LQNIDKDGRVTMYTGMLRITHVKVVIQVLNKMVYILNQYYALV